MITFSPPDQAPSTTRTRRRADPAPLADSGVMAILRGASVSHVLRAATALADSGIACLEVSLATPGAISGLRALVEELGGAASVGAGTVTSRAEAQASLEAGARFLVSPVHDEGVMAEAEAAAVPCYPGAWSPTEVLAAWRANAAAVKVFPASIGGPAYVRQLLGPLPDVRLLPTGGVRLQDAGEYIRAGATAVGVGGPLLRDALDGGDLTELARRAGALVTEVARARASRP